jgi:SOS-response transcriptional repressor LexA
MKQLDLTPRQQEVLAALLELSNGDCGPSLRQLGEAVGMASTWAVRRHLNILQRRGFIARHAKKVGGITVLSISGISGVAA